MKLLERQGKEMLQAVGVRIPRNKLIEDKRNRQLPMLNFPFLLKSQVPVSDRKTKGGIVIVQNEKEFNESHARLFGLQIDGYLPSQLLAEEFIDAVHEFYVSFSYSSDHRAPVIALHKDGGTGVSDATIIPVSVLEGVGESFISDALNAAGIEDNAKLIAVIKKLWNLFIEEHLLLAEINPLFLLADGEVIAGDAKMIIDDAVLTTPERPFISLGGDIAVIASGGGASMLNLDILMRAGGNPANYVEYSGNPPATLVEELTLRVLSQPGLRGAWVVGGTANFTDIYETMSGFAAGLRKLEHKPTYPIVIRRDGPRQQEAKEMLMRMAKEEGYNMHVYGPELSMSDSAQELLRLMSLPS